jgi:hypothetical protein
MVYPYIQYVEASPMFAGVMMLLLNVGSRYITHEYSDNDEEYMQNIFLRRLAIFAACFVGTRSIITSVLLTAGFVILSAGLFRGKSTYAREGMKNPDMTMRAAAGLAGNIGQPAYDTSTPSIF